MVRWTARVSPSARSSAPAGPSCGRRTSACRQEATVGSQDSDAPRSPPSPGSAPSTTCDSNRAVGTSRPSRSCRHSRGRCASTRSPSTTCGASRTRRSRGPRGRSSRTSGRCSRRSTACRRSSSTRTRTSSRRTGSPGHWAPVPSTPAATSCCRPSPTGAGGPRLSGRASRGRSSPTSERTATRTTPGSGRSSGCCPWTTRTSRRSGAAARVDRAHVAEPRGARHGAAAHHVLGRARVAGGGGAVVPRGRGGAGCRLACSGVRRSGCRLARVTVLRQDGGEDGRSGHVPPLRPP